MISHGSDSILNKTQDLTKSRRREINVFNRSEVWGVCQIWTRYEHFNTLAGSKLCEILQKEIWLDIKTGSLWYYPIFPYLPQRNVLFDMTMILLPKQRRKFFLNIALNMLPSDEVPGFATDCPHGVWCCQSTTCLLHICPSFGNLIWNDSSLYVWQNR